MIKLSNISKRQMTMLRKLGRKKHRYEYGFFIGEGLRTVEQILENGQLTVDAIYFDEKSRIWELPEWQPALKHYNVFQVPEDDFMDVCDTENPQGVFVVCKIPEPADIIKMGKKKGLILVMDRIQDPGNLGTMVRTAAWFGVSGIVLGKGSVDLFHPKVVRSTAGATGVLPYLISPTGKALQQFENMGWQIAMLDGKPGAVDLSSFKPAERTVLVVGNEAGGIEESLITEYRVRVAIAGDKNQQSVESLNAAMALGIAVYDLHNKM